MHRSNLLTFFNPAPDVKDAKAVALEKQAPRELLSLEKANGDEQRILNAFEWNKKPLEFTDEKLDKATLKKIAAATNSAIIHYSGNCTALAYALLYNLKMQKAETAIANTFPLHTGLDPLCSANIFFGQALAFIPVPKNSKHELTTTILETFQSQGERHFVININYQKPKTFSRGHVLNAVVIGNKNNPQVIYVDAWKSSTYVYTPDELLKEYSMAMTVGLQYHPGPVAKLVAPIKAAPKPN